jgi:hypothetical protein
MDDTRHPKVVLNVVSGRISFLTLDYFANRHTVYHGGFPLEFFIDATPGRGILAAKHR